MFIRINLYIYFIFHTLSGYSAVLVGDEIFLRKDLNFVGNLVCTSSSTMTSLESSGISDVVKSKVEDANIILKIVKIRDPSKLKSYAISLAKKNHHFGLLFGLCDGAHRGWMISVPSPVSLSELKKPKGLTLAKKLCRKLKTTTMLSSITRKSLAIDLFLQNLKANNEYASSITCKPKFPRWLGPMTWFIFNGKLDHNPVGVAEYSDDPSGAFMKWWQAVRRSLKINAIVPAPVSFNTTANHLASSNKIAHDHDLLQFLGSKIPDSWELLGENRARGTLSQVVENFWNSPNHRSLLLDSNATHGTVWFNSKTNFWVILTFKHRSRPIALK